MNYVTSISSHSFACLDPAVGTCESIDQDCKDEPTILHVWVPFGRALRSSLMGIDAWHFYFVTDPSS